MDNVLIVVDDLEAAKAFVIELDLTLERETMYDSGFSRRLRRVITEQAGKQTTWLCEIELPEEDVWSRSRGIEFLFDWQELTPA